VLLHDGGGDRSATVAALPAIIDGLRRLGLSADVWKFVGGQELAGGRYSCQALGSAR
jgi:peptidoglycan-N-acetylglucosamine deacetylase